MLREALVLVAVGVAGGLPAAWALSRYVSAQLYGIPPNDPPTLAIAALGLTAVAAAACAVPALRGIRVNPVRALRYE